MLEQGTVSRVAYQRDGYTIVRGLFTANDIARAAAEADVLLERCRPLMSERNLRCRWQPNVVSGESEFETFDPVIDLAPTSRELAFDPRLLGVLAELYGEPACLFKDKLIYKAQGLKGYGLHQDWIAWPGFPRSFLTVLVPFDPADRHNGATEVFPGYHLGGSLSAEDGQYHELPPGTVDESRGVFLEMDPGDVAIFGGFTPHRSAPNRSARSRRQLFLSYNKQSDGGEQRQRHYAEFHAWMRAKYGKTDAYFE